MELSRPDDAAGLDKRREAATLTREDMFESIKTAVLDRKRKSGVLAKDWQAVAEACRGLVEIDSANFHALHDLVVALRELKKPEEAAPWVDPLLRLAPNTPVEQALAMEGPRYLRYRAVCAEILLGKGDLDRADALAQDLKRSGVHFHNKHLIASAVCEKRGDLAGAVLELSEMLTLYHAQGVSQWNHRILAQARKLLSASLAKRDADGAYYAYVLLYACNRAEGDIQRYLADRRNDPSLKSEFLALDAARALAENDAAAEACAARVDWPELALRFRCRALARKPDTSSALEAAAALPAESHFRLELLADLEKSQAGSANLLTALGESYRRHNRVEEAFGAFQSAAAQSDGDTTLLTRMREMRELLLARSVAEDDALLLRREDGPGATAEPAPPLTIEAVVAGKKHRVRTSLAFRFAWNRSVRGDIDELRLRVAENKLRLGYDPRGALAELERLAGGSKAAAALVQLVFHHARGKNLDEARRYLDRFKKSAAAVPAEERIRLLFDLGDCFEAAGDPGIARSCYAAILGEEPQSLEAKARLAGVAEGKAPAPAPAPDAQATLLRERYTDMRVIGRGGMAVVYKAYDPLFARSVALKVMDRRFQSDRAAAARFVREGQAMVRLLRHDGIVHVYEIGAGKDLYIAMEFVEGASYRSILESRGRLPVPELAKEMAAICEALGHAHSFGIIHRDIKPDNLLRTADGKVKIADFGLAAMSTASDLTQVGAIMGTGPYMPPEQIRGERADARSDIYAFGVTLYELAAGRRPFIEGDIAYQQVHTIPQRPGAYAPGIPERFEKAVMKCLEKDPAKRWASTAELTAELKGCANA